MDTIGIVEMNAAKIFSEIGDLAKISQNSGVFSLDQHLFAEMLDPEDWLFVLDGIGDELK